MTIENLSGNELPVDIPEGGTSFPEADLGSVMLSEIYNAGGVLHTERGVARVFYSDRAAVVNLREGLVHLSPDPDSQ